MSSVLNDYFDDMEGIYWDYISMLLAFMFTNIILIMICRNYSLKKRGSELTGVSSSSPSSATNAKSDILLGFSVTSS